MISFRCKTVSWILFQPVFLTGKNDRSGLSSSQEATSAPNPLTRTLAQGCKTKDKDGKLPLDHAVERSASLEHVQALVLGSPAPALSQALKRRPAAKGGA